MTGVLAIQGDFEKHLAVMRALGEEAVEVRAVEELDKVERLIIPGGESTTVGLLLQRFGLGAAIQGRSANGMPIWGTCMGMIMMAREIEGREQYSLDLLDITVRRNAFGAQVHSFEAAVFLSDLVESVTGVFIRAPIVTKLGADVQGIGTYDGKIVAVRQGNRLGTSFHPELTDDYRLHDWFRQIR